MKKVLLLFVLIATTLFFTCNRQERNKDRAYEKRLVAGRSTSNISELPLGFNFGMTEEEVDANINKLIQDGVIRKTGSGRNRRYMHTYQLDNGISFESELDFDYYNGELYLLSLDIPKDNLTTAIDDHITNSIDWWSYSRTSYYSTFGTSSKSKNIFTYWIKENQIIRLRHVNAGDDIWYINAPIDKIISADRDVEYAEIAKKGREANKGAVIKNSYLDASVSQVEKYLKNNVNDYEGIEWSTVVEQDNGNFIVRHKYRDSYGVYNKVFTLSPDGSVVSAVNFGS